MKAAWFAESPDYLKEIPTKPSDLYREVQNPTSPIEAACGYFATEEEAREAAINRLVALKDRSEGKIKSPDGKTETEREHLLNEAKRHREIAIAGLDVLGVSDEEVENRGWPRPRQ